MKRKYRIIELAPDLYRAEWTYADKDVWRPLLPLNCDRLLSLDQLDEIIKKKIDIDFDRPPAHRVLREYAE